MQIANPPRPEAWGVWIQGGWKSKLTHHLPPFRASRGVRGVGRLSGFRTGWREMEIPPKRGAGRDGGGLLALALTSQRSRVSSKLL